MARKIPRGVVAVAGPTGHLHAGLSFKDIVIDLAPFHPQIVHFVVALGVVGVALRLVSLTGKAAWTSPAATTLLLLAAAAAYAAAQSGHDAHGPVERVPGSRAAVQRHEDLGDETRNLFLLVAALEVAALAARRRERLHRGLLVASGVAGMVAAFALYQAGNAGGQLVYSYAGGVGLRTGDTTDVRRLLVAGLYHQARAARAAGNHEEAARLTGELVRQVPNDPTIVFLSVESMIKDQHDAAGGLTALAAMSPPDSMPRLVMQRGMLMSEAYDSLGQPDSARATLQALATRYPQSRFVADALSRHP